MCSLYFLLWGWNLNATLETTIELCNISAPHKFCYQLNIILFDNSHHWILINSFNGFFEWASKDIFPPGPRSGPPRGGVALPGLSCPSPPQVCGLSVFFVFDVCLLFVVDDHMINGQWSLIILVGPSLPNVLSSTSIWSSWSCWSSWSSQLSWLSPQPWELRLREQGSKWAHRRCAWFLTFIWLNFMIKLTLPQASVIYKKNCHSISNPGALASDREHTTSFTKRARVTSNLRFVGNIKPWWS